MHIIAICLSVKLDQRNKNFILIKYVRNTKLG